MEAETCKGEAFGGVGGEVFGFSEGEGIEIMIEEVGIGDLGL